MSVNIHGKEYKTVAERLSEIGDKLKGVSTEVLYLQPQVMVKATITTDKGTFTGISAADPSKSIEAKTPVEVAETSAVGRALAFAGYAGSEIASADEMAKALTTSPKPTTAPTTEEPKDYTFNNVGALEEPFEGEVPCKACGGKTTYKEFTSKAGNFVKGYFCNTNKDHKPFFVK